MSVCRRAVVSTPARQACILCASDAVERISTRLLILRRMSYIGHQGILHTAILDQIVSGRRPRGRLVLVLRRGPLHIDIHYHGSARRPSCRKRGLMTVHCAQLGLFDDTGTELGRPCSRASRLSRQGDGLWCLPCLASTFLLGFSRGGCNARARSLEQARIPRPAAPSSL